MTSVADAVTVSQLLGRIVYFHALFIEPATPHAVPAGCGEKCCNHGTNPGQRPAGALVPGTAWAVLDEVAGTIPVYRQPCPADSGTCCAVCHVATAGAAIATGWADTEYRFYYQQVPAPTLVGACGQAAATRIGREFAAQQAAACPSLEQRTAAQSSTGKLPGPDELPLAGELLALWICPAGTGRRPVVSWLNHCTSLEDIRQVLDTRRTGL